MLLSYHRNISMLQKAYRPNIQQFYKHNLEIRVFGGTCIHMTKVAHIDLWCSICKFDLAHIARPKTQNYFILFYFTYIPKQITKLLKRKQ